MQHMLHELIPFISQYGLWVVFFGVIVEGTTMILVTGILCYLGMLDFKEALPVAIFGAVLGDQFWYYMGKHYAPILLKKFPKLKEKIDKLKPAIEKKGEWFSGSGRFVYSGAVLFPVALGTYGYPHSRFTFFDAMGVTLWATGGILFGYLLGSGAEQFIGKIESIWHFALLVFVSVVILRFIFPIRNT
jgi:membrane protein DedA with SNARE-associated domain